MSQEFTIEAEKKTFRSILSGGYYKIPGYQREYAWEEEEISEYWDDLASAVGEGHFLRNVVVHGTQDSILEVVDGQQRMTTTLILLCVIRDKFLKIGDEDRFEGIQQYIQGKDDNGQARWHLEPNDKNAFLQSKVYHLPDSRSPFGKPSSEGERKLKNAISYFEEKLEEEIRDTDGKILSLDESAGALSHIRDRALGASVVHIRLGDRKAAFDIFETLNDRGKSLSPADLVKTYMVSVLDSGNAPEATVARWDNVSKTVGATKLPNYGMEDFLRYHWNSLDLADSNKVVISRAIRKSVARYIESSDGDSHERAQAYVSSLEHSSLLISLLSAPYDRDRWREVLEGPGFNFTYREDKLSRIRRQLWTLNVWGAAQSMPLVLSLLQKYIIQTESSDAVISTSNISEFLNVVESMEFRWRMSGRGSTSVVRDFYRRWAIEVARCEDKGTYSAILENFRKESRTLMPSDAQARDGVKNISYIGARNFREAHAVRTILGRVNESWGGEKFSDGTLDHSIEHLKGQKGVAQTSNRNLWIGRLGNLLLVPSEVNSSLPERPSEKRESLRPYVPPEDEIMQSFLDGDQWTADASRKRLGFITDIALEEVWPVP